MSFGIRFRHLSTLLVRTTLSEIVVHFKRSKTHSAIFDFFVEVHIRPSTHE